MSSAFDGNEQVSALSDLAEGDGAAACSQGPDQGEDRGGFAANAHRRFSLDFGCFFLGFLHLPRSFVV